MRITMISIGSTGDVRPYVLLGRELRRRGHEIRITCFAQFEKMVKDAGLETDPARAQGERSLQARPASTTVGSQ